FLFSSSFSIITAFLIIFSRCAILVSTNACSSLAESYSEFSDKSPQSRAVLILSTTSFLFTVFKSCNSFSTFSFPSSVMIDEVVTYSKIIYMWESKECEENDRRKKLLHDRRRKRESREGITRWKNRKKKRSSGKN